METMDNNSNESQHNDALISINVITFLHTHTLSLEKVSA